MSPPEPVEEPRPPMPAFHPARLVLVLEHDPRGAGLLVSSPHLSGWRTTARGPLGLAAAVDAGWRENAVRAYAHRHGEPYDLEAFADVERRPRPAPGAGWVELDDGRWRSPGGYIHGADTTRVRRLREQRDAARQDTG